MTLARLHPPSRTTFDANEVLDGLLPMIRPLFGKRIQVEMTQCRQPAWIHMDVAEFEASVLNIAKNASDAMTGDGTFHIESDIVQNEVRLRLADSGCGMPQSVATRIFEPFFTTKPAMQGTGIGLAMVYRAISESDGRIDVVSAPGQGTCFTLHLPLCEQPHHAGRGSPL